MKNNSLASAFKGRSVSRLFLCLCPVVAGAMTGIDGLALGVILFVVLLLSGLFSGIINNVVPENACVPAVIFICCAFAGIAQMLVNVLFPVLAVELGVFIPLCGFASMICLLTEGDDCTICAGIRGGASAIVMLTLVGVLRELIGYGRIFGATVCNCGGLLIARYPAGAFILFGVLAGIYAAIRKNGKEETK